MPSCLIPVTQRVTNYSKLQNALEAVHFMLVLLILSVDRLRLRIKLQPANKILFHMYIHGACFEALIIA